MLCREACGGLMQPSMRHPFSERCLTPFAGGRGTPRGWRAHNSRFPPFPCFKALNFLGVSPVIYPSHTHTHTRVCPHASFRHNGAAADEIKRRDKHARAGATVTLIAFIGGVYLFFDDCGFNLINVSRCVRGGNSFWNCFLFRSFLLLPLWLNVK
ncbi:unnamed protein product [Trypanosoma congolense IL3000]|uniref:WGS project CAEQ00000000 data, annotated contig 1161 n=1 Tax=Trypanosoma congolense (strain IL3000) TaxID=1068625 RepID=F9W494_TRYCI|nr:unnamed protein product [Trypanosoma congolense IL3000]